MATVEDKSQPTKQAPIDIEALLKKVNNPKLLLVQLQFLNFLKQKTAEFNQANPKVGKSQSTPPESTPSKGQN